MKRQYQKDNSLQLQLMEGQQAQQEINLRQIG